MEALVAMPVHQKILIQVGENVHFMAFGGILTAEKQ